MRAVPGIHDNALGVTTHLDANEIRIEAEVLQTFEKLLLVGTVGAAEFARVPEDNPHFEAGMLFVLQDAEELLELIDIVIQKIEGLVLQVNFSSGSLDQLCRDVQKPGAATGILVRREKRMHLQLAIDDKRIQVGDVDSALQSFGECFFRNTISSPVTRPFGRSRSTTTGTCGTNSMRSDMSWPRSNR